jgi:hypothetical protein
LSDNQWDATGNARRALRGIVTDPHYGAAALSQPAVMSNLLKDLMPDQPREAGLLVAAAQSDLAGMLRGYAGQGVDPGTAIRLTSGSFVANTSHTPDACTWVVTELAAALGMQAGQPTAPSPTGTVDQAGQATVQALSPQGQGQPTFTPLDTASPGASPYAPPAAHPQFAAPGPGLYGWQAPGRAVSQGSNPLIPAGITALAGALFVLLGCVLPFVKYPTAGPAGVFGGFPGAPVSETFWYAIEPAGVLVIAVVLAIMLMARRGNATLLAGLMTAFGVQTTLLFSGYTFVVYSPAKHGAGGVLGLLGGIGLLVAGLLAARASSGSASSGGASSGGASSGGAAVGVAAPAHWAGVPAGTPPIPPG